MKTFKLPVSWEMGGVISIEAETVEDAIERFDKEIDHIRLPEGTYVVGSFRMEDMDPEEILELYNGCNASFMSEADGGDE